jgi:hypothetical protein
MPPTESELFKQLYVAAFPAVVTAFFNGTLDEALEGEASYTDVVTITEDLANLAHQHVLRSLESLPQDDLKLPPRPLSVTPTTPPSKKQPAQHHQAWTPDEDDELKEEFGSGMKTKEIAAVHNRSELAIRSRLLKLNLLASL